jgi:hypothetical protein
MLTVFCGAVLFFYGAVSWLTGVALQGWLNPAAPLANVAPAGSPTVWPKPTFAVNPNAADLGAC